MRRILVLTTSVLLVSVFGFLFPFAYPGRRLTLSSLIGTLVGVTLACWLGNAAFQFGGLSLAVAAVAGANAATVFGWFAFVLAMTEWLGPYKPKE